MARPHLLLVDADPRAVRVLEVNFKNDGFSVTTATDGAEALAKIELALPDVLVAETRLPRLDGFELVRRLRELPGGVAVPVVLVAPESGPKGPSGLSAAAVDQLRSVEFGIPDCVTKPVSVRELVTRVNLMLARRTRALLSSGNGEQSHFSGHLQDIGAIDLIQALETGRRSGVLQIQHGTRAATVVFKDGKVIDAEQGQQRGEEALYRTFLWTTGVFDVEFFDVDAPDNITIGTPALIMEGMRRIDEWGRLAEQLPSSASVFTVDADVLLERLAEVPDELNPVLRLFDGQRSLLAVIEESPFDDLSTLSVVSKLYFEGVLQVSEPAPGLLTGGRAMLGSGAARVQGNVIRLPHVSDAPQTLVSVRPNAPEMRPDPLPRSLVYSEPPQNVRLSQRVAPGPSRTAGATLMGMPVAAPPATVPSIPRAIGNQINHGRVAAPVAEAAPLESVARVEEKALQPAVSEAEFEDVADDAPKEPGRKLEDHKSDVVEASHASAARAQPPRVQPVMGEHHAAGQRAPLEHDEFFAEGDQGTYDGGPLSIPARRDSEPGKAESEAELEIDPRVLAALRLRREQNQRWVKGIVGVALLLLIWGVVVVVGRETTVEDEPVVFTTAAPAPVALPAAAPEPSTTGYGEVTAEPAETIGFEEVPPQPATFTPGVRAPLNATGLPLSSDDARPLPPRGKRPPTARFPSTPDMQ